MRGCLGGVVCYARTAWSGSAGFDAKVSRMVYRCALSWDDIDFITPTVEERGNRTQVSACDLGAIETDCLFVNPFEWSYQPRRVDGASAIMRE